MDENEIVNTVSRTRDNVWECASGMLVKNDASYRRSLEFARNQQELITRLRCRLHPIDVSSSTRILQAGDPLAFACKKQPQ